MKKEMEKTYNHQNVEDRIYAWWLEKGYFHAEPDESRKPYTIVIPPPNITSQLHMGHAFDCTLQDILIRFKRMQGYNALWLPGTDHASIATEVKIVERMAKEGISKEDLGREKFLERAWAWREEFGSRIVVQIKKIGSSCDWERERFTMDEGLNAAVLEFFVRLYEKGLIYRGEKLVNWCSCCQTTISDAEVEHIDKEGALYHIKYPVKGTDKFIQFATTRPETILADTAVAVNPKDERYTELIGQTVTVPIVNREIPVIADDYVDIKFGTGVVKITPGHDPNDFLVGERHDLERINILNDDGTLNNLAGNYSGMTNAVAREEILKELDCLGLYVKSEKISHAVGTHDRCKSVIEPRLKVQWFVKMTELAQPAVEAYKSGELRIFPERFGKIYLHWLENIRDWCVSRQLWWGHRIPAYYCDCGKIIISKNTPENCPECGNSVLKQDEDVLDTWFSSALWPFSTMGWPEDTPEYKYFYPTSVLSCGADILFFWGVRMVFSGIEMTGRMPFKDLLFHGLIRDAEGRKMSKSLGNGIDPLEMIEQYGADSLRMSIVIGNASGADFRFHLDKLVGYRNFCNKIWNAARFILMNMDGDGVGIDESDARKAMTDADKWLISSANRLAREVSEHLDAYELGIAAAKLYDFIWDEFCDWAIEMSKPRLYNKDKVALWVMRRVFLDAMRLLHPFMPFITEEIFAGLQSDEETIMLSCWPVYNEADNFPAQEKSIAAVKEAVKAIRVIRNDMNVPPSRKAAVQIASPSPELRAVFEGGRDYITTLASASQTRITTDTEDVPQNAVSAVISGATIYMPLEDLVDAEKEIARLTKERERLLSEVARVEAKLANKGFTAKAPQHLIDEETEKGKNYREMLKKVDAQLKNFI